MEITKSKKTAVLLGATGLIGGYCLDYLLKAPAYGKVTVLTRTKLELKHEKLDQHIINFDLLEDYRSLLRANDIFCCLGTTRRKAGNKAAFYKVDFTYCYESARIAAEEGASQFFLVSSVGSDADSLIYYFRVKGEIEKAIKELPYWSVHIFQPSVLLGERPENRWGEQLASVIGNRVDSITGGMLSRFRPIEAEVVAKAMVSAAQGLQRGIFTYPSGYLQKLANEMDEELDNRIS